MMKLVLVLLLTALATTAAADPVEQFEQANTYYEAKLFDSAVASYQAVLATGVESAPLYFNLGNSYFRNGDLGLAILFYLRAKRLSPDDPDVAANLEFARRFTSVQMEGVKLNPIQSLFESIVEPYHLDTLAWLSSALFILTFLILTARYGFGFSGLAIRSGLIVAPVLLVAASLFTTIKYNHDFLTMRAVVVADECIVRTGPSDLSDKELDAAPGLIIEILGESGDFYNVLFENKRRGWVQKDLVAVV